MVSGPSGNPLEPSQKELVEGRGSVEGSGKAPDELVSTA